MENTLEEMRRLIRKLVDIADDVQAHLTNKSPAFVVQADLDCAEEIVRALSIMNDKPRLGSLGRNP